MRKTEMYEKPQVQTIGSGGIIAIIGPSVSCTGFGGSASC